jgi:uncharacterized protein
MLTRRWPGGGWRRGLALALIFAVACTVLPVAAQVPVPPVRETPTTPEGVWAGGYWLDGVWTFIQVELTERRSRWSGTLHFPYRGGMIDADTGYTVAGGAGGDQALPLDAVHYEAPELRFEARTGTGTLTFQAEMAGGSLSGGVLWEPRQGTVQNAGASTGTLRLSRIVLLEPSYAGYNAYVGDYRILPDEAPLFVGRSGVQNTLYLSAAQRQIGLLPLGGDQYLTTTGHELTFERYDGDEVVGFILSGEGPLPWALEGATRQVAAHGEGAEDTRAVKVGNYRTEEVRFSSGNARLAGTVVLPHGPGPYPAVVFTHSWGPETRERRRELAAAFARQGIASIIYDKRGTGASSGNWRTASLYDLVEDTLAALRFLKPYLEVDLDAIGVWGAGQGGWAAPLAAIWSTEEIAFVITVSGPGMSPGLQDMYRWRNTLLDLGATPRQLDAGLKAVWLQQDLHQLEPGFLAPYFPAVSYGHYAVSVLERLEQPLLALWGAEDRTVPPWTSARRYEVALARAGNEDATLRVFSGADHTMRLVTETEDMAGALDGPWVAYPAGYVELMADWILAHTTLTEDPGDVEIPAGALPPDVDRFAEERVPATALPWYGRSLFQFGALLVGVLLLLSGGLIWTMSALQWLLAERPPARILAPTWALFAAAAGALLTGVLLLILIGALARFVLIEPALLLRYLGSPVVRVAAWLAPVTAVALGVWAWWAWRQRAGTLVARIHLTAVLVAALGVLPLMAYWRLLV